MLAPGTGADHPGQNDSVKVNYSGWTTDGKMFDSSVAPAQPGRRPEPMTMALSRVIPGWTEGIQLMVVGEKRRMWIPEELAYKGKPGAPAGMLVFDVELLDITPGPKPPPDVAAPPKMRRRPKMVWRARSRRRARAPFLRRREDNGDLGVPEVT